MQESYLDLLTGEPKANKTVGRINGAIKTGLFWRMENLIFIIGKRYSAAKLVFKSAALTSTC